MNINFSASVGAPQPTGHPSSLPAERPAPDPAQKVQPAKESESSSQAQTRSHDDGSAPPTVIQQKIRDMLEKQAKELERTQAAKQKAAKEVAKARTELTTDVAIAIGGNDSAARKPAPEAAQSRTPERAPQAAPERTPDRAVVSSPERKPELGPERGPERAPQTSPDRTFVRTYAHASERATDPSAARGVERAPERLQQRGLERSSEAAPERPQVSQPVTYRPTELGPWAAKRAATPLYDKGAASEPTPHSVTRAAER